MTDANGDLVETDPDEEDTTTELSTPENIAEMIEESNSNHQIEGSQNKTLT